MPKIHLIFILLIALFVELKVLCKFYIYFKHFSIFCKTKFMFML